MNFYQRNTLSESILDQYLFRLTRGYLLALGLIGFLAVASLIVLIAQIHSQRRFAAMSSFAGEQRALCQRVVLLALRLIQEPNEDRRAEFRTIIERSIADVERIQHGLLLGDPGLNVAGHPGREIELLYLQPPTRLESRVASFCSQARTLLRLPNNAPLPARAAELEPLLQAIPGDLLAALDRVLAAYEQADAATTTRLQVLETMLVTLLLLSLAAQLQFIFKPLINTLFTETRNLETNRRQLDAVVRTVGEAILTADGDNVIRSANRCAEQVWKFPASELVGMSLNSLLLSGRDLSSSEWRATLSAGRRTETIGVRRGGETFPLEFTLMKIQPDTDDQDQTGDTEPSFTISARDVTERVETARELAAARDHALESTRAKSEFVANMSHEIRTPMSGILGVTELLQATELNTEQRDLVETIHGSGEALLTIINDILDFSKIEAGKMSLETIDFDLRQIVESTGDLMAGRALQKKLELIVYVEPDVPPRLRGDPGRLRQVLLNLLSNAIKFTETGEIVLRVSRVDEDEEHARLRFEVRDTGIGIDATVRNRLFNAFTQAEDSTARRFGGTGLGLTISRQLIDLMGGEIDVDSQPGKGSAFWFTANFSKQVSVLSGGGERDASRPVPSPELLRLHGTSVLIVDDNATLRELLGQRLRAWGMSVDAAEDGGSAMKKLRERAAEGAPYQLALIDLNLRSMDGFTLAWSITSQPGLSRTRLILVTSLGLESDRKAYEQVGICASLTKPLKHDAVVQTLAKVLADGTSLPGEHHPEPRPVTDHLMENSAVPVHVAGPAAGHILLAEDNLINRKLAVRQLVNLGFQVDAVCDGQEALDALEEKTYDLVLLDMFMPVLNGYEAASSIRHQESESGEQRHLTLIAMTASTMTADRERCMAAGMDDFITKPVRQQDLGRVLSHWLATQPVETAAHIV